MECSIALLYPLYQSIGHRHLQNW
uniref:Uncharacterized protein n=1 Tax=Arundo donax TaxID=35708 RepID=A0A0A9BDY9_ARUDO